MNEILAFTARAAEKFGKDELYSFVAGLSVGLLYFILFIGNISSYLTDKGPAAFLYPVTLVTFFLVATGMVYVISQFLTIFCFGLIKLIFIRRDWEAEKENYLRNGSKVRYFNEFNQFTLSIHVFNLIAAAFVSLIFIKDKISSALEVSEAIVAVFLICLITFLILVSFLISYRWLKLEKLFLMGAFFVTGDINTFLTQYGPYQNPSKESKGDPADKKHGV